jgi:hypothetical protein
MVAPFKTDAAGTGVGVAVGAVVAVEALVVVVPPPQAARSSERAAASSRPVQQDRMRRGYLERTFLIKTPPGLFSMYLFIELR